MLTDTMQNQRVTQRNFVDQFVCRRQRQRMRFEAGNKNQGTKCKRREMNNLLAVDIGIVQNGSKSSYESLADTTSAQAAVIQRNDELSGQKLPGFVSVETICV